MKKYCDVVTINQYTVCKIEFDLTFLNNYFSGNIQDCLVLSEDYHTSHIRKIHPTALQVIIEALNYDIKKIPHYNAILEKM